MNCPFIEENEPRCSECLNMQNLEEAFVLCNDEYHYCPLYLELSRERMMAAAGVNMRMMALGS